MWIVIGGIGMVGLVVGIVLFSNRSGDREAKAASSYIKEHHRT